MLKQPVTLLMFLSNTAGLCRQQVENDPLEKGPHQTFQSWIHTRNTVTLPNIGGRQSRLEELGKPTFCEVTTRIRATWFVKLVLLVRILHNFKMEKAKPGNGGGSEVWSFFRKMTTTPWSTFSFCASPAPSPYKPVCAMTMKPVPMCFRIWEQKQRHGLGDF